MVALCPVSLSEEGASASPPASERAARRFALAIAAALPRTEMGVAWVEEVGEEGSPPPGGASIRRL